MITVLPSKLPSNEKTDKTTKKSSKLSSIRWLFNNLSEEKNISFKKDKITLPKINFANPKEVLEYLRKQKKLLIWWNKENNPEDNLEIRLSPEESNKIEMHHCVECDADVKRKYDEGNKHAIAQCSKCGAVYHQYDPYGTWHIQP